MTILGTIEMGGTKTDVAVGTSPDDLANRQRIPTAGPDETLDAVIAYFRTQDVAAIGVASFGPLDLDEASNSYGTLLATPKPGWTGTAVLPTLRERLSPPVSIDTDVNGAALGEGEWGATRGMSNFAYVTVGTGIGAGVVIGRETVRGGHHPEFGHVPVRRMPDDQYPGRCPYHGDCLEGMAAGPALEARFGDPSTWAGNDRVLDLVAHYVAQGMQTLVYTVAPERIIIGGGVSSLPGFHDRVRTRLGIMISNYPEEPDLELLISKPGLGDLSGLAGGLILARQATV